jgi:hypothetical protein
MNTTNAFKNYSHETSVVILLILLIVIGVAYNIIEGKSSSPDFSLCPLCNDSVIYHPKEEKQTNETITF